MFSAKNQSLWQKFKTELKRDMKIFNQKYTRDIESLEQKSLEYF